MSITINQNNLAFEINTKDYTAKIIESNNAIGDILIPKYVDYFSKKYIITRIEDSSFKSNTNIRSISFVQDSEIQSFGKNSFAYSSIINISIPKSVKSLEDYSFYYCKKLKTIEIPENSELQSFGSNSLDSILIENLFIPRNVTEINMSILQDLKNLKFITISPKNMKFANYNNDLVIGKSSYLFDQLVFVRRDVRNIKIPSFIKEINSYSVSNCRNLKSIEFEPNSKLSKIGLDFLKNSLVKSISSIPSQLTIPGYVNYEVLDSVEFLAEEFQTDLCFYGVCHLVISLPNCKKVHVEYNCDADIIVLIRSYAIVSSYDITEYIFNTGFEF